MKGKTNDTDSHPPPNADPSHYRAFQSLDQAKHLGFSRRQWAELRRSVGRDAVGGAGEVNMEILAKLYLELATIMPPECVSLREKALRMRIDILESAAAKVCRLDWSDNDDDAVATIDTLRELLPPRLLWK